MINFLIGSLGSGKSYEAVAYHLLPALKSGRRVITNLPVQEEYLYAVIPEARNLLVLMHPTVENPIRFSKVADFAGDTWRHPESGIGPLFIIDECHKPLPRGSTDRLVDEWFAESRHSVSDALLITQSHRKVSAAIVDLSQLHYRVRKNIALGMPNQYIRKVQDGPRGEVVNQNIRTYEPSYFKFYKSHTRSDSAAEAGVSDVKPIWQHWSVIGSVLFLLFGVIMFATQDLNPLKPKSLEQQPKVKTIPSLTPSLPAAVAAPADLPKKSDIPPVLNHPLAAYTLHVAGSLQDNTHTLYAVDVAQNGQRVFSITSEDLRQAGYGVRTLAACMVELTYQDLVFLITCGVPQASVQLARG